MAVRESSGMAVREMAVREFDVVVVGAGGGGLSAAIRAHDIGLRVTIVEALDRVGGATAFSGGQVWVGNNELMRREGLADSAGEVEQYVFGIADERNLIDATVAKQWIEEAPRTAAELERANGIVWEIIPGYPDYYYPDAPGSKAAGRYLTAAAISGSALGEHRELLLTTPHFPLGVSYAELFGHRSDKTRLTVLVTERAADDVLTFGTAIAAHLFRAAILREIPIFREHRAVELVLDRGTVAGVRCDSPSGTMTVRGAVVLATSTYDWDPDLVEKYSWLRFEESGSVSPPTLRGDGIRLAEQAGAHILALPADALPHVPGYFTGVDSPYDKGFRTSSEFSLPHCFIVNRQGKRFCNDSLYQSLTRAVLGDPERTNSPFFLIWDEQHHQKYGMRPADAGMPYPDDLGVVTAPTLEGLAAKLDVSPDGLVQTADRFNTYAREGVDPDFGRGEAAYLAMFRGDESHQPNAVLGTVEQPPFYGMPMRLLGTGIGAAGVHAGLHGQALDESGDPIPGLYAVGSAAALSTSGTGYNSGFSLSRAITFGCLAAEHVRTSAGPTARR